MGGYINTKMEDKLRFLYKKRIGWTVFKKPKLQRLYIQKII